ncbi:conserved hypothetical protein [Nocardioides sp. AX2bis]|nr:conserved hypothetical protein [Nocardioides sp. AX2bis]
MGVDQVAHDRETQAGPGGVLVLGGTGVPVEEVVDEGLGHAGAGVVDGDRDPAVGGLGTQADRRGAVLHRVGDQVVEDLLQAQRVGDERQGEVALEVDLGVGERGGDLLEDAPDPQRAGVDPEHALVGLRRGEQVLDHQRQPPGQLLAAVDHPGGLVARQVGVLQQLEVARDPGDRDAHVVGHDGGEVVARGLGLAQVGVLRGQAYGVVAHPAVQGGDLAEQGEQHDDGGGEGQGAGGVPAQGEAVAREQGQRDVAPGRDDGDQRPALGAEPAAGGEPPQREAQGDQDDRGHRQADGAAQCGVVGAVEHRRDGGRADRRPDHDGQGDQHDRAVGGQDPAGPCLGADQEVVHRAGPGHEREAEQQGEAGVPRRPQPGRAAGRGVHQALGGEHAGEGEAVEEHGHRGEGVGPRQHQQAGSRAGAVLLGQQDRGEQVDAQDEGEEGRQERRDLAERLAGDEQERQDDGDEGGGDEEDRTAGRVTGPPLTPVDAALVAAVVAACRRRSVRLRGDQARGNHVLMIGPVGWTLQDIPGRGPPAPAEMTLAARRDDGSGAPR